jgi:organic hydroperoxide reductase OsmC/OhrA
MTPFPHRYRIGAQGHPAGHVEVADKNLRLVTDAPPEFGGPDGFWSPEALLVAAVADCYVLSFRAVARASKLEWDALDVEVEGVLDRVDGVTRFVRFEITAKLVLAEEEQTPRAHVLMDKAKRSCLITNSLGGDCILLPQISVGTRSTAGVVG